jgi:hypothetical protein
MAHAGVVENGRSCFTQFNGCKLLPVAWMHMKGCEKTRANEDIWTGELCILATST